jgi:hypothetical protein
MEFKTRDRKISILRMYCKIHDNDCGVCKFNYENAWCQYPMHRLTDETIDKAMQQLTSLPESRGESKNK